MQNRQTFNLISVGWRVPFDPGSIRCGVAVWQPRRVIILVNNIDSASKYNPLHAEEVQRLRLSAQSHHRYVLAFDKYYC